MTTVEPYDRRKFKASQNSDDEEIQLSWIRGLIEQVEFANKPGRTAGLCSPVEDSKEVIRMMREFIPDDYPDVPFYYQDTPAGEALADWAEHTYFGPHRKPMKFYDDRTLKECR